jgi:adenosylcobinamide hydrolase
MISNHLVEGRPLVLWQSETPVRAVSTSVLGGGIGLRSWWINHTVDSSYHRDPVEHLQEIATGLGVHGEGLGMLTAVDVAQLVTSTDERVIAWATVGLGWPTWAAAPDGTPNPYGPGTINIMVLVPARLSDAALVNALATATEAKAQALIEAGIPGTGTASDSIALCCVNDGPEESYGGPRSTWGARVARAVHAAMHLGIERDANVARSEGRSRTVVT